MPRLWLVVFVSACAAWFGALLAIALFLPTLFAEMPTNRTLAGRIAAHVLGRFDMVRVILLGVLWFAGLLGVRGGRAGCSIAPRTALTIVLLLLLTASVGANLYLVHGRIAAVRPMIVSFEMDAPMTEARREFDRLHVISRTLSTLDLAWLAGLLIGAAVPRRCKTLPSDATADGDARE